MSHSFIFADDTDTSWLHHGKNIIFKEMSNGSFISSTLDRIFAANLPYILNIHPSYFKSVYFSSVEAIILIFLTGIMSFILNKKNNLLLPIAFIFSGTVFFYIEQQQYLTLFVYDGFFRMVIPTFMLIVFFILFIIKNKNRFVSYIILPILAFLCSLSNEFISITCIIGTFLYSIISILKKDKNIYSEIICFIFAILGAFVLIKTGMFTRKNPDTIYNLQFFISLLKIFPEFTFRYIKYVLLGHFFGHIVFLAQVIF
ncbi:hypothetical protein IJ182_07325 [bacterium]|nr:hypothetical protein [bacterium]